MDIIEKFLRQISYKFPKGYPDITDEQDMLLLYEILNKKGIDISEAKKPFDTLSSKAKDLAKSISDLVGIPLENFYAHSINRILIVAPEGMRRGELFDKIEQEPSLNLTRVRSRLPGSSAGGFKSEDGIEIILKDSTTQRLGSAGLENEQIFNNTIKSAIEQVGSPIKIIIKGANNKTLVFNDVTKSVDIGRDTQGGKKSDIDLYTSEGVKGISLKKDGAFRWASAMTAFPELYDKFIGGAYNNKIPNLELVADETNPALLKMVNPEGRPYGRLFILNFPPLEKNFELLAFGSDKVSIIQRTFNPSDFSLEGDTLTINVTKIYTKIEDIPDSDRPIIEFERNASKATKTDGYKNRGIIMRISPRSSYKETNKGNKFVIDYKDIP
jgi:hypothetical protein